MTAGRDGSPEAACRGTLATGRAPSSPQPAETVRAAASHGPGETLLLIDDAAGVPELVRTVLVRFGYTVFSASKMLARPVALFEVYTEDVIVERGILNHGMAFLDKPFTADTRQHRVREALDGR